MWRKSRSVVVPAKAWFGRSADQPGKWYWMGHGPYASDDGAWAHRVQGLCDTEGEARACASLALEALTGQPTEAFLPDAVSV